jgi:hypothetical protein
MGVHLHAANGPVVMTSARSDLITTWNHRPFGQIFFCSERMVVFCCPSGASGSVLTFDHEEGATDHAGQL